MTSTGRVLTEEIVTKKVIYKNKKVSEQFDYDIGSNFYDPQKNIFYENKQEKDNDRISQITNRFNSDQMYLFIKYIEKHSKRNTDVNVTFIQKEISKVIYRNETKLAEMNNSYNEVIIRIEMNINSENHCLHENYGCTNSLIPYEKMIELYDGIIHKLVDFNNSDEIKSGKYNIILAPVVAGVLVHEFIGHLCEADTQLMRPDLSAQMKTGKQLFKTNITIYDDPKINNFWGSYDIDDEGNLPKKTALIQDGIIQGYLHSERTAQNHNLISTGHARSLSYKYQPLVRMSNTILETGHDSLDKMIDSIDDGYLAVTTGGGVLINSVFMINIINAYKIKKSKIIGKCNHFFMTGNVFETFENIEQIGTSQETCSGGGCEKWGQGLLPVSITSPHILVKNVFLIRK